MGIFRDGYLKITTPKIGQISRKREGFLTEPPVKNGFPWFVSYNIPYLEAVSYVNHVYKNSLPSTKGCRNYSTWLIMMTIFYFHWKNANMQPLSHRTPGPYRTSRWHAHIDPWCCCPVRGHMMGIPCKVDVLVHNYKERSVDLSVRLLKKARAKSYFFS